MYSGLISFKFLANFVLSSAIATALLLSGNGYWDLRTAGDEITNNATTPTGDILLSTKNFAVGDNYTIIIEFR